MSRRRTDTRTIWAVLLALPLAWASAQSVADREADDATEKFLADHHLDTLLAVHLRDRLIQASGTDRVQIADRLGELYVRMHSSAATARERGEIETLGRELIRLVPDAESFLLRLNLAKSRYLIAEEIAERYRMRLATPEERADAQRTLREVGSTFDEVASRVQTLIDALERQDKRPAAGVDPREVRQRLDRARRERSLARFYGGWTRYYNALLDGQPSGAAGVASDFGWLLGAPGKPASVEKAPKSMLRYEHIARSALGCAMAASLLGNDAEAERWFDLLQTTPEVSDTVLDQLFTRRMIVYGAARRWADIERLVTLERSRLGGPLPVADARLLAVIVLEAGENRSSIAGREAMIASLAQSAFKDLIERGELGQIVDLVNRYGSAPVGENGFVAEYVRAVKAYDRAMEAHKASGLSPEQPATAEANLILFRDAAGLLQQATRTPDAAAFAADRDRAAVLAGVCLFLAARFEESADLLEAAAASGTIPERREEAIWLAIASLDLAVDGDRPSLSARRDRLAMLYLEQFPTTERAARLLIRRASDGLVTDARAAEILLGVSSDSPLYGTARRYAARLLYRAWRSAGPDERARAARAFMDVANELVLIDESAMEAGTDEEWSRIAAEMLLRERQVLDVVLSGSDPDVERARRAIANVEMAAGGVERLGDIAGELAYRRLQIAVALNDDAGITRAIDELTLTGGKFAEAGDRIAYRLALDAWRSHRAGEAEARKVIAIGNRLIERIGTARTKLSDPSTFGLHDTVSEAAAALWRSFGDSAMRDRSLAIDREICDAGLATGHVLRRRAELAESAGLKIEALDAWRSLLAGYKDGTTDWFESRYNSLRLLLETDPVEARQAFEQYAVLRPDFGPEPWKERFELLRARIEQAPAPGGPP